MEVKLEWKGAAPLTVPFDGTEKRLGEILGIPILKDHIMLPNSICVQDELGRKCIMTVGKRGTRKVNGDDVDCLHIMNVVNAIPVTPSSYEEQEWRCINVEGNNYKKYFLRQVPGGLQASYGSIDVPKDRCKQVKALYPSLLFYALDAEKRSKGYVNVTEFTNAGNVRRVVNEQKAPQAAPKTANEELYQFLLMLSKRVADRTISTPAADITEKMVERARQALATMKAAMEADDLNGFCSAQEDLMLMLPHKRDPMQGDKIKDYLPRSKKEMPTVWDAEEARVNAADALVSNKSSQAERHAADFKQFGVHVWKATAEQKADVLSRINPANRRFVKEIYRIKPDAQVAKFDAYKKAHGIYGSGNSDGSDLGVQHYFHGSDNANWFSILKDNGLRNMPAVHGRMFGDLDGTACYYAPSFDKAGGYQSSSSRWNTGNSRTGIVGMFAVCMGKPLYVTRPGHYTKKDLAAQGKNSVYAKAGQAGLRADEVVAEMSCLEYLIVSEV